MAGIIIPWILPPSFGLVEIVLSFGEASETTKSLLFWSGLHTVISTGLIVSTTIFQLGYHRVDQKAALKHALSRALILSTSGALCLAGLWYNPLKNEGLQLRAIVLSGSLVVRVVILPLIALTSLVGA